MLLSLQVKNLALIEESEIVFRPGLNIMTGETGAGKSILIGSMNLALGEKINREFLRDSEKDGYVELVFSVDNNRQRQKLSDMDLVIDNDELILSRRITENRSICKVNGETVPVGVLRNVASLFIDIYGQKEHQVLLNPKKHLDILDQFAKEAFSDKKNILKESFQKYARLKKELEQAVVDDSSRSRELSLLEYEVKEIEEADLHLGEDEELETQFRKMVHMQKIAGAASSAIELLEESEPAASELIGRSCRELSSVASYDEDMKERSRQLEEIDQLLSDFIHDIRQNMEAMTYREDIFQETEQRLNLVNGLKMKYGDSLEQILEAKVEKEQRIDKLQNYDLYLKNLKEQFEQSKTELEDISQDISTIRRQQAVNLTEKVQQALQDLNFLTVSLDMCFHENGSYSENGYDNPEFMISTNPGEPLKPLERVASGGELSRIMLALKSVVANSDEIGTLIFDEIDTGISGRTAQKVAEKMNVIARNRQVISITHLPQIAAMADVHFLFEKNIVDDNTISTVRELTPEQQVEEIARMLGGVEITDAVRENAKEMRNLAILTKNAKS